MNVQPFPHEEGKFYVQSASRPELQHTVDLRYLAEGKRKPVAACSCEDWQARGTQHCRHIIMVIDYEKRRLGL